MGGHLLGHALARIIHYWVVSRRLGMPDHARYLPRVGVGLGLGLRRRSILRHQSRAQDRGHVVLKLNKSWWAVGLRDLRRLCRRGGFYGSLTLCLQHWEKGRWWVDPGATTGDPNLISHMARARISGTVENPANMGEAPRGCCTPCRGVVELAMFCSFSEVRRAPAGRSISPVPLPWPPRPPPQRAGVRSSIARCWRPRGLNQRGSPSVFERLLLVGPCPCVLRLRVLHGHNRTG